MYTYCMCICVCVCLNLYCLYTCKFIYTNTSINMDILFKAKSMWAYTYCEYPCSCIYITYTLYHQIEMGAWVFCNHVHPQSRWNYFFSRTIVNQIFHVKSWCHTKNHTRIFFSLKIAQVHDPLFCGCFWLQHQEELT